MAGYGQQPQQPGMIDPNSPFAQALAEEMMAGGGNMASEEEMLRRQLAQAQGLRVMAPTQRMDTGSQIARAVQGIGSGITNYQAGQKMKALGEREAGAYQRALGRTRQPRTMGATEKPYDYGDIY